MKVTRWFAFCILFLLTIATFAQPPGVSANIAVPRGGGRPGGHVQALAIDPSTPATLYAATAGAGIFKTINGGTDWIAVNTGLANMEVLALAIDPSTPSTLYAGTDVGGLFKTVDGGEKWTMVSIQFRGSLGLAPKSIVALAIDPSNPGTLYVGSDDPFPFFDSGQMRFSLFKTTNGGISWTVANSGLVNGANGPGFNTLAIDPSTPTTVYVGTSWTGAFKSTNGGLNWTAFNSGWAVNRWAKQAGLPSFRQEYQIVNALAVDPSGQSTLYAGTSFEGVFKSTNGGSWTATNSGLTNKQVFVLAIDPSDPAILYASTHGGIFKSTNAGRSWVAVNVGLSNRDIHALAVDPSHPAMLYAGSNGGGVFKSTNGGATWQPTGTMIGDATPPAKSRSPN